MGNKVKFGLSNVHVLVIDSYNAKEKTYTYDNDGITPIPGAVNLSLDPQGDSTDFFADDIDFFAQSANTGYQGTLEIAMIPPWFRQKVLGEVVDNNGVQIEKSDATQKEIVLFFEINGDKSKTRFCMYRCSIARPSVKGQTTEKNITPSTDSMTITAMPRENDHCTKGFIAADDTEHKAIYESWYKTMHEPAFAAASE
ncbi:MAG: major tail protein [Huintestinicola sp.]